MQIIAVVTTIDSEEGARRIAGQLVQRRLAACVQISAIESVYEWDGAVQRDNEQRLVIKTTTERYAAVETAILELHSYDLPAILAFETEAVFEPFADWVVENTTA